MRTDDDEPSPGATRRALRDVVGRCLYGVDVNPMAVELWGSATPDLIAAGIPDDAFKRIEGVALSASVGMDCCVGARR